jgi:predicted RNA-binding protein YlxR (DUF448 family)
MVQRADGDADQGQRSAAAATERLCIATRAVRPVGEMIRFVAGPDGTVVPDLKRRLPGRGVWVTARRRLVEEAVRRQAFGRSLKGKANAPADLAEALDRLLERSALDALSIAHKAGLAVLGFARVEAALAEGPVVALIRARDGGAEGARKLAALRRRDQAPVNIEVFDSAQLDLAVGRLNVVHAALLAGRASETVLERWRILESFRAEEQDDLRARRPNDHAPQPGS